MTGTVYQTTLDRFQDFDLSEYLYLDESSATYARPRIEPHVDGFLRPYTAMMWVLILAAMVLVLGTLYLVNVGYGFLCLQSDDAISESDASTDSAKSVTEKAVKNSAVWTFYAFLNQSVRVAPSGDSVRLLSGLWLLTCFILASVYRCNLKAMLILPKVAVPFDSLDELVRTDLPVWVAPSSALSSAALSSPPSTSLGKLAQMFTTLGKPINIPLGIRDLVAGKHVLAGPKSALVQILHGTFSQTGKCANYLMSEGFLKTAMLTMIFPKGSTLKPKVDKIIVRLREAGILDHLYKNGVSNATECLKPFNTKPNNEIRTLDLADFYGVFLVYLGGITLAILSFATEVAIRLLRQKKYPQNNSKISNRETF